MAPLSSWLQSEVPDDAEIGPPTAMDLFSGRNAPLACALAWCGWEVEAVDILHGDEHDLRTVTQTREGVMSVYTYFMKFKWW